jgi:uncharacterized membrane protein
MNANFYVKLYLLTIPGFFILDMLWLGWLAADFYQQELGHLLAEQVNWFAALSFYLIYILGILIFAVVPGLKSHSLWQTLKLAALFGCFTYLTYELTNMATLPNWSLPLVVVDTLWGILLCSLVASMSHFIGRSLLAKATAKESGR